MSTLKYLQQRIPEYVLNNEGTDIFSRSEEEIFKHIWEANLPNDLQVPTGNPDINRKGAEESEAFRNEGNRIYKAKILDKALIAYNYALLSAPHPIEDTFSSTTDDIFSDVGFESQYSNGQYSHLAFAYANRSALLLELNQYKLSLEDVNNSIYYGYTHGKRYKMFERKIKILIGLRKLEEARDLSDSLINNISKFQIDSKEKTQITENLKKLKDKCLQNNGEKTIEASEELSSTPSLSECVNNKENKFSRLFFRGGDIAATKPPPVTDILQVQQTKDKGRYLVAAKDISPGDLLMTESSLCSFVLFDQQLRHYCSNCMRRTVVPLPCNTCSLVVFCSAACRSVSLCPTSGHHARQCTLLPALVALQPEVDAGLAFSAITRTDMSSIVNNSQKLLHVNKEDNGWLLGDQNSFYDVLLSLEGNINARSQTDRREVAITAVILGKLLMDVSSFWKGVNGGSDTRSSKATNDVLILGKNLIRILYNIQCNAHCVKETKLAEESTKPCAYNDVGYGVYQKLSLLNHSCVANTHLSSDGDRKILYAISSIKRGDEVTLSYGERYVSHRRDHRRENLRKTYYFTCNCLACRLDWPVYADLPMKFNLRCCKCSNTIDLTSSKCSNCQLVHKCDFKKKNKKGGGKKQQQQNQTQPQNIFDAQVCQREICQAWTEYNEAYKNTLQHHSGDKDFNSVKKLVSLLDQYAHHPNQPYTEAQETFIKWFDVRSAATFVNE